MSANDEYDPDFDATFPKPRPRRGSRLIEVLVIGAIVVLLIALFLPAFRSGSGPAARRAQCTNNLKQIALALHNYVEAHDALPPAYTVDAKGRPLHSWRTLILPYLEQEALYKTIDLAKPWNDPANAKAVETRIPVFRCPSAAGAENTTTYLAIVGPTSCFLPKRPWSLTEVTDGHDETLMVIEADDQHAVPWMAPEDADESLVIGFDATTELHHAGGTNGAFVDGSVRFLKAKTPANVRRAWMSIAGNDNEVTKGW